MSDLTGTVRVQCRHGACFTLMRWKKSLSHRMNLLSVPSMTITKGICETREKEDAFVERIVAQAAEKTLANLPTLAGMYLIQQQAVLTAGFQSTVAGANAGMPVMPSPANGNGNGRIKQGHTAEAVLGESAEEEPEDNEFLDYSFGV